MIMKTEGKKGDNCTEKSRSMRRSSDRMDRMRARIASQRIFVRENVHSFVIILCVGTQTIICETIPIELKHLSFIFCHVFGYKMRPETSQ